MNEHAAESWSVGRTLLTQQTRQWPPEEWEENERRERRRVFAHFTAADEGRGRELIAECRDAAHAPLIAAAPAMLRLLENIVKAPREKGSSLRVLMQIRGHAQDVIDKAKGGGQ